MKFLDVKQEKIEDEMRAGIKAFDPQTLRTVDTEEKVVLPSPEGPLFSDDFFDDFSNLV